MTDTDSALKNFRQAKQEVATLTEQYEDAQREKISLEGKLRRAQEYLDKTRQEMDKAIADEHAEALKPVEAE